MNKKTGVIITQIKQANLKPEILIPSILISVEDSNTVSVSSDC
jgi:hypothetical protein